MVHIQYFHTRSCTVYVKSHLTKNGDAEQCGEDQLQGRGNGLHHRVQLQPTDMKVLVLRIRITGSPCFWVPDPDPDPLVRGMDTDPDPDPDPSIIMQK